MNTAAWHSGITRGSSSIDLGSNLKSVPRIVAQFGLVMGLGQEKAFTQIVIFLLRWPF